MACVVFIVQRAILGPNTGMNQIREARRDADGVSFRLSGGALSFARENSCLAEVCVTRLRVMFNLSSLIVLLGSPLCAC